MAKNQLARAQIMSITAGNMPAQGTWWWSGDGGVDLVGGAAATGLSSLEFHKADEAVVDILVSSFNAVTFLEFRAQEKGVTGQWSDVDPPIIIQAPSAVARFLDLTGGKLKILAAAAGQSVRIRVPLCSPRAFRFGVTPGDANARATAALTAGLSLLARDLYS